MCLRRLSRAPVVRDTLGNSIFPGLVVMDSDNVDDTTSKLIRKRPEALGLTNLALGAFCLDVHREGVGRLERLETHWAGNCLLGVSRLAPQMAFQFLRLAEDFAAPVSVGILFESVVEEPLRRMDLRTQGAFVFLIILVVVLVNTEAGLVRMV